MEKEIIGIYCFENKINGKKYIGQSCNIYKRLKSHKTCLNRGVDKCFRLQRAVNKYGIENFNVYILEICKESLLNEREVYWISEFNTNDWNCGYNVSIGGSNSLLGYRQTSETKRKLSEMKKGTHLSEEHKKKIGLGNLGKVYSEETRRKISEKQTGEKHFLWGKHHSDEARKKMSESRKGSGSWQFGKKKPNSSSQYIGVRRLIQKGFIYWQAGIKVNRKDVYIGMSKDEIEAARMYDSYVTSHNLPNPLNFPEENK